jgi:hypothetical protein
MATSLRASHVLRCASLVLAISMLVYATANAQTVSPPGAEGTSIIPPATKTDQNGEVPAGEYVLMFAWTRPEVCNSGNAEAIRFREIMRDSRSYEGRCIVTNGFWRGRALFRSESAGNQRGAFYSASQAAFRIGLYAREEVLDQSPRAPNRARIVGVLRHCDTAFQGYGMVLGYCHSAGGPILLVSNAALN